MNKDEPIIDFRKKTEAEARRRFAEWESHLGKLSEQKSHFLTDIGFESDSIESYIRKNPVNLLILSNSVLQNIVLHKGEELRNFIDELRVPVVVIPEKSNSTGHSTFKISVI